MRKTAGFPGRRASERSEIRGTATIKTEGRRDAVAMPDPYSPHGRREHRRRTRFRIWNRFVMAVGYLALAYGLVRGVIYLLVLAEEWL